MRTDNILLVNPCSLECELIADSLRHVGVEVVQTSSRRSTFGFDLVIERYSSALMFLLPELDTLPTVVLCWSQNEAIAALDAGAADAVVMSSDFRELALRVRRILRVQEELARTESLAHLDELTQLYNRRGLFDQLGRVIARAEREGAPFSVLLIDLDDFKKINDGRGHAVGDAILQAVSATLLEAVREDDIVARLGGDEFVVLLPNGDADAARQVATRIARSMPMRASMGIVTSHAQPTMSSRATAEMILRRADERMFDAKRRGKASARPRPSPLQLRMPAGAAAAAI